MALMIVEIDSDDEARSLVESGDVDFALVEDVVPAYSEGGDQSFCRVFACRGRLADVRRRLGWDHPPDSSAGDDFVVAWDKDAADVIDDLQSKLVG